MGRDSRFHVVVPAAQVADAYVRKRLRTTFSDVTFEPVEYTGKQAVLISFHKPRSSDSGKDVLQSDVRLATRFGRLLPKDTPDQQLMARPCFPPNAENIAERGQPVFEVFLYN